METIKLDSHIGKDGILQIQMPADFKDTSVQVVLVVQPLSCDRTQSKYNAWGKLTNKESIQEAIARMRQLQQEVALESTSIRDMIEEGRRF